MSLQTVSKNRHEKSKMKGKGQLDNFVGRVGIWGKWKDRRVFGWVQ